jgi:histidinol-phosphate/aromatic aminotransferase/cobyric acid decarboxylase-like protein/choline kinase
MNAVILAAGHGNRMRPITDTTHKTLIDVGGQTVIGRIVSGLVANGIARIAVVTGYRAEEVEAWLRRHHPEVRFQFVRNERYRETNNIFSMALALEHLDLDDDILLIESDLVCDAAVFERIIRSTHPNAALVDHYRTGMDGTVVTVADRIITSVIPPHLQAGDFSFADKYKTLNIYKFSKEFCRTSLKQLLTFYARTMDDNCYYELILGILIYVQKAVIGAEIIGGEKWAEIDDPNDLRIAEYDFNPRERRRILEETMGGYWAFDGLVDFCFVRNMHFPTASVLADIRNTLPQLVRNYGSKQDVLNRKLAFFLLCAVERVNVLNGASQVYPFLRQRFGGSAILLPEPTFGEYARTFPCHRNYSDRVGIDPVEVEERATLADIVVFVNPNNPTGTTLPTHWIHGFAQRRSGSLVIVDESFIAFSDQPSMMSLLEDHPLDNVLVIGSLSKFLGVPGVRLGYVYTSDHRLCADIAEWLPIWNLNSVAEHLLEILLKHRQSLAASVRATVADRTAFAEELARVDDVDTVHPSGANFLLVTLGASHSDGAALVDLLLDRHRIYVKDVSERINDGRTHLRVAVRLPEENSLFCEALGQVHDLARRRHPDTTAHCGLTALSGPSAGDGVRGRTVAL